MVRNLIRLYHRAYLGLPREIWLLSLAAFVNRFGTMVLPFFTLYLTSELGYPEAVAGRMLSVYGLGAIAGAYAGGRVIGRIGAVRVQILFALLSVPLFLAVPLFRTWPGIAAAMFMLSFFSDGSRPAAATAISEFAPPEKQVRAFGLHRMALNLGISFGPAIGGLLATVSFVWLFVADALTTLMCALTLVYFFGVRRHSRSESADLPPAAGAAATVSPRGDLRFLVFLALILLTSIVFFQFHATYPLFLKDHYGLSKPAIGLIYAVNTGVIVVFEMLLLNYIQGRPPIRVIGWGTVLSCFGFGILPFGRSVGFAVFSMLIITLGEMLWMPLASGWIAQRSQPGNRGAYMGWYMMTYSLAAVIAPALGGAVYQVNRDLIWFLSLSVGLALAVGFTALQYVLRCETPSLASRPAITENSA